jgi:hypothetical protein
MAALPASVRNTVGHTPGGGCAAAIVCMHRRKCRRQKKTLRQLRQATRLVRTEAPCVQIFAVRPAGSTQRSPENIVKNSPSPAAAAPAGRQLRVTVYIERETENGIAVITEGGGGASIRENREMRHEKKKFTSQKSKKKKKKKKKKISRRIMTV